MIDPIIINQVLGKWVTFIGVSVGFIALFLVPSMWYFRKDIMEMQVRADRGFRK